MISYRIISLFVRSVSQSKTVSQGTFFSYYLRPVLLSSQRPGLTALANINDNEFNCKCISTWPFENSVSYSVVSVRNNNSARSALLSYLIKIFQFQFPPSSGFCLCDRTFVKSYRDTCGSWSGQTSWHSFWKVFIASLPSEFQMLAPDRK